MAPRAPDPIESLCALDAAGRGIGRLVIPGAMAAAAASLVRATRVALVTGFRPPRRVGRRDRRPLGTVVLGAALRRHGAEARLRRRPAGAAARGGVPEGPAEPLDLIACPPSREAIRRREARLATPPSPPRGERAPRPAADGDYYNAGGSWRPRPRHSMRSSGPAEAALASVGDGRRDRHGPRPHPCARSPNGRRIGSVVRPTTSSWTGPRTGGLEAVAHCRSPRPRPAPAETAG